MARGLNGSNVQGAFDRGAQQVVLDGDPFQGPIISLTGSTDAIPIYSGFCNFMVTTAGVDAMTLAAPVAGTDDGLTIAIFSNGAHAHTLTSTGNLQTGATGTGVLTFAAHAGAGVILRAYNAFWQIIGATGITVTS